MTRVCAVRIAGLMSACQLAACLVPPGARPAASHATDDVAGEPQPIEIWSGDGDDARGSGWASCEQPASDCDASLDVAADGGVDGSAGLRFRARGNQWLGFGWNWFSWWPGDAGTDVSRHASLTLAIRVVGDPGLAPEPFTLRIALGGSARGGRDATRAVPLLDYAPDFACDGRWYSIVIPLGAMLRAEGEKFDTARAWSFTIGAWNQGERSYEIFIDDVRVL